MRLILYIVAIFLLPLRGAGPSLIRSGRIFSVGNGSMADCPLTSGERGWMQMVPMYFSMNLHFENGAIRDRNAFQYLNEGHWGRILNQLREGDYVWISFEEAPAVADGREKYRQVITRFIEEAKNKKAIPVLFTPVTPEEGKEAGASLTREVAAAEKIRCIDAAAIYRSLPSVIPAAGKKTPFKSLELHEATLLAAGIAREVKMNLPELDFMDSGGRKEVGWPPLPQGETADYLSASLKKEAALNFNLRQLPLTRKGWESYRRQLRESVLKASGARMDSSLPLDIHLTGTIPMNGFHINKIYFQTREGIYATANLYIPEGKGPFPAIINLHGHWPGGKSGDFVQSRAQELAMNGYVCLNIDAWGSGERTTVHGVDEYHGSNLGASLMNIGESLLGNQLTDNFRGVDLLCSLPYVDKTRIGATGASGGGNQTMWLSALDERIRASMPVVSVGTFQSYIMGSNCVCELLPGGLSFTEESGILALIAPRSVKICSGLQDPSSTFLPSQMIRSFINARPIFALYGKADPIQYQLFNTPHGYWPEMREAMLGWFNQQLKGAGNGESVKEVPFQLLKDDQLMVFRPGKRDPKVVSTFTYCYQRGHQLTASLYKQQVIDTSQKLKELQELLFLPATPDSVEKVYEYEEENGWKRKLLQTRQGHLLALRYHPALSKNSAMVLICSDSGNDSLEQAIIRGYNARGLGVVLADLWGTGKMASAEAEKVDGRLPKYHTLARAELWLGHTILGEWVSDLRAVINFLNLNYHPSSLCIDSQNEMAVSSLMESALFQNVDSCVLRNCPLSYCLDKRAGIDYFDMAIHLPHILEWGDISLVAALNRRATILFHEPVSITGEPVTGSGLAAWKDRFSKLKLACRSKSNIRFN